jgi:hypothetical protein
VPADEVEQELAAGLGEGQIAELVEDDEVRVRGAGVNPRRLSIRGNRGYPARPPGFAEEEIDSGMSNDIFFCIARRMKHCVSQFT